LTNVDIKSLQFVSKSVVFHSGIFEELYWIQSN